MSAPAQAGPRRRDGRAWTAREDDCVRQLYPEGGAAAVIVVLTWRTYQAVRNRARKLGIVYRKGRGRPRRGLDRGARHADARGEQARRTCLACGHDFDSEHRGNRICPRCTPAANRRAAAGCFDITAGIGA